MTDSGGGGGGAGYTVEGANKKEKELVDIDNRLVIAGGGGTRGLKGNIKIYNKIKLKKKRNKQNRKK